MADGPLISPQDIPQIVPNAIPQDIRQFGAGLLSMGPEALRFGALLANPMRAYRGFTGQSTPEDTERYGGVAQVLQGAGDAGVAVINRALGVDTPSALDDTSGAAARFLGGSLPIAPFTWGNRLAGMIAQAPAAGRLAANIPLRAAELLTPLSITNKTGAARVGPVAANVAVQTTAAAGFEKLTEGNDPTQPYKVYDAQGNLVEDYTPSPDNTPGAGRIAVNAVTDAVGEHPWASAGVGAAALGAGILARRSMVTARNIREASEQSDAVGPLSSIDTDVPIIPMDSAGGAIRNGANRFAEVVQDANIRSKDAVAQAERTAEETARRTGQTVNNETQATRDAIDASMEAPHKDRVIAAMEQGRINTPRGVKEFEPLRRQAEELYHRSSNDPDFKRQHDELIAYETELDNRAYAFTKGADRVDIDVTTGERATRQTPPQNIASVIPRATLHHISDADLLRRIRDIRASNPEVVQYANRYWDTMEKLADAWVDFGLVSKAERAAWGKANPHFMHTINFDDPKSPRTYRLREHGSGPKIAGDPHLAATEYMDFMLAHAYKNRRNQRLVESLRKAADGPFGNGKWLGRVAHPVELRRQQIMGSNGQLRNMTREDVTIQGDSIHYYDNGEKVDVEIRNKQLLHTMQTMPTHAQTILGWMRQIAQSGMTGNIALATGQPFTLANMGMGMMMGYITRPAGRSFGMLDKGMQRLTTPLVGKRILGKEIKAPIGVRADPTAILGGLNSVARDTASILTRAVSEAFYNSITGGGKLAKTADAAHGMWSRIPDAQSIADGAAKKFLDSVYAENHLAGSGGASSLGNKDFDTAGGRASLMSTVAPHLNQSRVVTDAKGFVDTMEQFKGRVTPADVKIAARMIKDINEAIGNMAQSYIYRSNRGKGKELDEASKPLEARVQAEYALARPHQDRADTFKSLADQANRAAVVATTATQARQYRQLAAQHKLSAQGAQQQADIHYNNAKPMITAANKAREEWFREVNSLSVVTRQLLGDPGQMGTGLRDLNKGGTTAFEKGVGWILDSTPYGNIGMQASARLIRAAKENPLGTATAIGLVLGPMAYLPIAAAIRADNQRAARGEDRIYVKWLMAMPSWQTTRYMPIPMDGVPPENTPMLRIDPLLSLPYTLFREGVVNSFGLLGDPDSDPTVAESHEQIMRLSEARQWNNIRTAMLNASPINQVPPAIGAGAAALGFEIPAFEQLAVRGATPIPTRGLGSFDQSRLANDVISKQTDAIVGQLAGGAGLTWVQAIRSGWQAEQRERGTFIPQAVDTLRGKAMDRLPEFAPLWPQQARRATNDFLADTVNSKEGRMRELSQNTSALRGPGTVGTGNEMQRDEAGGGRAGVDDPQMRQVIGATIAFNRAMSSLQQARGRAREQLISVEQQAMPYADQRLEQNRISREVTRINGELLARYTRFEDQLSNRLGYRIRIDEIDPRRPISQFKRLGE